MEDEPELTAGRDVRKAQTIAKLQTEAAIDDAELFDPPADWKWDIRDIPDDHNVSDFVLGVLELLSELGEISKKTLSASFPLVYTKAGKPRQDRPHLGRPFLDPEGHVIALANKESLCGSRTELKKSKLVINILQDMDNFPQFKASILDPSAENTKKRALNKKQDKTAHKKRKLERAAQSPIDVSGDESSDENSDSSDDTTPKKAPAMEFRITAKLDVEDALPGEDINKLQEEVFELRQKLEREQHLSATLKKQQKASDALVVGTNQLTQDILTACANFSANIIESAVTDTTDLAAELYDSSEKVADYLLSYAETTLEKQRKLVAQERAKLQQLTELVLNPDGEMARVARGMAAEKKKDLQEKRTAMRVNEAEIMRDIEERTDEILATAQKVWAERKREHEEKKIMDRYYAEQIKEMDEAKAKEADEGQIYHNEDEIENLTLAQARAYTRAARTIIRENVQKSRRSSARKAGRSEAEIAHIVLPEWLEAKAFITKIANTPTNAMARFAQDRLRLAGETW
jgi:hypothetical protein